jgi:hypothetical protein
MGEKSSLRRRKGHSCIVAECEAGVGACRPYPYRDLITIESFCRWRSQRLSRTGSRQAGSAWHQALSILQDMGNPGADAVRRRLQDAGFGDRPEAS